MANTITLTKSMQTVTLTKGSQTITLTQTVLAGGSVPIGLPTDGTWADGLATIAATYTTADAVAAVNEAALGITQNAYTFQHLRPAADNTYDLGNSSTPLRWRSIYLGPGSMHVSSLASETGTARDYRVGIVTAVGATQGYFALYEAGTGTPLLTVAPAGAVQLAATLGVTGAVTLSSTLGVTGATTLAGLTAAATSVTTLAASGAVTLSSTLGVTGTATLGVVNAGATSVTTLAASGAVTLSSTLGVTGTSTLGAVSAGATTVTTLGASGAVTLSSTLSVSSTATLSGNATVGGTLGVTGAATLSSTLTVNGAAGWYLGSATIANLDPSPSTVRYAGRGYSNALTGGDNETTAMYYRVSPGGTAVFGIYGEVDSTQTDTHGGFCKVVHAGAGDAFYAALRNSGLGFEMASFYNGSRGFAATNQRQGAVPQTGTDFGNTVHFNSVWGDDGTGGSTTVPNYGAAYFDRSLGRSIMVRIQDPNKTGYALGRIEYVISNFALTRNYFEIYNSGEHRSYSDLATSGQHYPNGAPHRLVSAYWTGAASADVATKFVTSVSDAAGTSAQLDISIGAVASETLALSILSSGIRWGATSSFPYLKRNATALNVRLGDDSADAPLTASNLTLSGTLNVTGTSTLGATNTGAFTATTGSFSSTLGVTGAVTLSALNAAGVVTTNSSGVLATNAQLPAGQFPALTGDVTTSAGSLATTVAKVAGTTVSGTTGTGNVVFSASPTLTGTLTAAAVTASGTITLSGLNAAGVVTTNSSGVLATNTRLPAAQFPALTGDVTTVAGAYATTVAAIAGTTVSGTTGTGNVAFSASPTFTGTLSAATVSLSANLLLTGASPNLNFTNTGSGFAVSAFMNNIQNNGTTVSNIDGAGIIVPVDTQNRQNFFFLDDFNFPDNNAASYSSKGGTVFKLATQYTPPNFASHPGCIAIRSGASGAWLSNNFLLYRKDANIAWTWTMTFLAPTPASNGTTRYLFSVGGMGLSAASVIDNGPYIQWEDDINSGNIVLGHAVNGTQTTSNTSTAAPTANTWHTLVITLPKNSTTFTYTLDGVSLGTVTDANFTTSITQYVSPGAFQLRVVSGSGQVDTCMDRCSIYMTGLTR